MLIRYGLKRLRAWEGNISFNQDRNLGTPLISFETTHGLFLDGVEFSETETNEIHTALLTSRAGIPQIELEEIVINDVGSFSMDLQAIHPEFYFFKKLSGPDWINIVSKDGNLGQASILGIRAVLLKRILMKRVNLE